MLGNKFEKLTFDELYKIQEKNSSFSWKISGKEVVSFEMKKSRYETLCFFLNFKGNNKTIDVSFQYDNKKDNKFKESGIIAS